MNQSDFKLSLASAFLRGSITAAKGLPNIAKYDPVICDAIRGLPNVEFLKYHERWVEGWKEGTQIQNDLRMGTITI